MYFEHFRYRKKMFLSLAVLCYSTEVLVLVLIVPCHSIILIFAFFVFWFFLGGGFLGCCWWWFFWNSSFTCIKTDTAVQCVPAWIELAPGSLIWVWQLARNRWKWVSDLLWLAGNVNIVTQPGQASARGNPNSPLEGWGCNGNDKAISTFLFTVWN